jgi:hypothetical protein
LNENNRQTITANQTRFQKNLSKPRAVGTTRDFQYPSRSAWWVLAGSWDGGMGFLSVLCSDEGTAIPTASVSTVAARDFQTGRRDRRHFGLAKWQARCGPTGGHVRVLERGGTVVAKQTETPTWGNVTPPWPIGQDWLKAPLRG